MIYIHNKFFFEYMDAQVISSTSKEVKLNLTKSDIGTMYIIQHELLKNSDIEFAGVIVKHPLTNDIWMRVNSTKSNPTKDMETAADSAIETADSLKKLFNSKIKV